MGEGSKNSNHKKIEREFSLFITFYPMVLTDHKMDMQ